MFCIIKEQMKITNMGQICFRRETEKEETYRGKFDTEMALSMLTRKQNILLSETIITEEMQWVQLLKYAKYIKHVFNGCPIFVCWTELFRFLLSVCNPSKCNISPSLSFSIHRLSLFSTFPSFCSLSLCMYPFPSLVCSDTPLHSPRVEEQRDWLVLCLLEVMKRRSRRE